LIDFGFAHKYRSSRTGKHIKYKDIRKYIGSLVFCSINGNKGYEQSRKDDLESLGYMLIYLALDYLPWIDISKNKTIVENDKFKLLTEMKSSITSDKLCNGLPEEFTAFINYCRNLEFEQDPNYDYLKSLFTSVLSRNFQKNELFFFWAINKDINRIESKSAGKSRSKRKISSQKNFLT
jgi:serine/threonine protein kinase